jgi:hypothetical protein
VGVIKLTDQAHAKDDLTALGTTDLNPLTALPGEQLILGRVDFAEPAVSSRGGYYYFILIDKRTNTGVFELYDGRGSGWGSNLDLVAERYPWLSALAPQPVGQGWRTTGASALQVATKQTSETFVALIPEEAGISADDLLLTMVFMGSDGQIYWATQVPLTTV